jgi:hypothetical protein
MLTVILIVAAVVVIVGVLVMASMRGGRKGPEYAAKVNRPVEVSNPRQSVRSSGGGDD